MVLPRDPGEDVLQLLGVDAVLLGVGGREQAEGGRGADLPEAPGAVVGRRPVRESGEPGVLQLLHADRHRDVKGPRRDGVRSVAQRLGAGRAHVLDAGDGLHVEAERARERQPGQTRTEGPEPEGVDVAERDTRRGHSIARRINEEVVCGSAPVLAEGCAAHPDDRDAVLDPPRAHGYASSSSSRDRIGRAFQK